MKKYLKRILYILVNILLFLYIVIMFVPLLILSFFELMMGEVIYYIITGSFDYTEFIYEKVYEKLNKRFNCNFTSDDFTVISFLPINLIIEI